MIEYNEMPQGLTQALAKNPKAMQVFSNMDTSAQNSVIDKCHGAQSKHDMERIVSELTDMSAT